MTTRLLPTKYLLWYAQEHVPFRLPEFESLASLFKIDYKYLEPPADDKPFLMIETSSPEKKILHLMSRTVLARSLCELWSVADCFDEFRNKLLENPQVKQKKYCGCDKSFRIIVEAFGKKISIATKVEKIEQLDFLEFKGSINLKNPDNSFHLYEYYGNDTRNIPEKPYKIIFGRWIADSQRKKVSNLSLKDRKFIANTSMDTALSLLMGNLAKVTSGDLILDPFVGSGSLLVAAAYFGGYVLGTDIDYLLLHGLSKPTRFGTKKREDDENVLSNFKQYKLESRYIDVVVADSSAPLWRSDDSLLFDAIITDPPYGIREAIERIGTEKQNSKIPEHLVPEHIPSKIRYPLQDVIKDLIDFSASKLKLGGRLVFWLPITDDKSKKINPEVLSHPKFVLKSQSEQQLTCFYSRILFVLERIL